MQLDTFKLERTRGALKQLGVEQALFSDYYNVSYLTGYTNFLENGPSPFTRGVCAALFTPGRITLIAETTASLDPQGDWTGAVEFMQGYGYQWPDSFPGSYLDALTKVVGNEVPTSGKVGVERHWLSAAAWGLLQDLRPNVTWIDLPAGLMLEVRAIKSPAELETLRAAANLSDVGQEAVRQLVREPGKSEIEVYSQAKAAMEASVGERFALQNALHGGENSGDVWSGWPTDYVLQRGDLIISDMVPYYQGYWGDSCSAFVVGGEEAITSEHRRIHQIARDAFYKGLEAVRPGISGDQLDGIVRGHVRKFGYDYPHHTGHGVGVSNQEEPRIIPGCPTILQPGMVLLMEPAVYIEGYGGVRQERMVLVTGDGPELLSHNPLQLA